MKIIFEDIIPPKGVLAFKVKKGQYWRVIDIEGKQVGDMVIFNEHNYAEKLSCAYTRTAAGSMFAGTHHNEAGVFQFIQGVTTGTKLMSTLRTPMATVTADTPVPSGVHDTFGRSCSRLSRILSGLEPEDGCLENLTKALEPYGIPMGDIPDSLNIFSDIHYDEKRGGLCVFEPVSRPSDYIEFQASEMDLLVAISACPEADFSLVNGPSPHRPKPLKIQILEVEE